MSWSIEGKRVVLTGATGGIGRETALALARKGANLTLIIRDRERGEKVIAEMREQRASGAAEVIVADLSSLADVRRAASEYLAKHDTLDCLINNAGAINMTREVTVDGYERTFATNHLSYFLLTSLLLDTLKKSAPSRIIVVASHAHRRQKLDFDDLMAKEDYSGLTVYGRSKLANILFARELSKRLAGTNVTCNSLHPGVVDTGFGHNDRGVFSFLVRIASPFMKTAEDGAKTTIYLASSPEVSKTTGKYFDDCKESTPTKEAQDDKTSARLWKESEKLVERKSA